jgi:hypothetical protein
MKLNAMKWMVLSLAVFFTASIVLADDVKVLKVFVFKVKKGKSGRVSTLNRFNIDDVELYMPTDEQLKEAKKAVENMDLKQEDLKQVDQNIPVEIFVLQIKKADSQSFDDDDLVNGIAVLKPTDEDLDKQKYLLKKVQGFADVVRNFEFQIGFGGAPALSPKLGNSYHNADTLSLGVGYQFTPFFETLLNFDINDFPAEPAIADGGLDYNPSLAELLFKFRFMPTGVRPYLFFGPAVSRNNFSGSFTYESFSGTTNYQSKNDFAMVGGLGVDIPLTDMTHFFVQGEVVCNFVDNDTANLGTLDQPSVFLPIELGLTFGR